MVGQRRKVVLNTKRALELISLEADHEYGFTDAFLEEILTEEEFKDFEEFMFGQTKALIALNEEDDTFISATYAWDFRTWVEGGRNYD